ncbi:hypothetical protein SAMN04487846_3705 [Microbacterium sp. cf046]|uniref:hypothetical protein n=1 Tax=Microbacterium sp. cf046 TaxID=1761803 RepID=UPI0008E917A6|nr:hypothetical protein [Microbacterium sp. cf046]SFS17991.1 hypothetical protein SAMN04487846_3705 [Microbacterium sp. cf046]
MKRVRGMLLAVALALALSAVAAGPAVAAKGGNSDNAHACQQGGHQNRFEAETGRPFKNAGDCVSHAAKGGEDATLFIDSVFTEDSCGNCWGVLQGSVSPNVEWQVFFSLTGTTTPFASGRADNNGSIIVDLDLPCGNGSTTAYVVDLGDGITTQPVGPPNGC